MRRWCPGPRRADLIDVKGIGGIVDEVDRIRESGAPGSSSSAVMAAEVAITAQKTRKQAEWIASRELRTGSTPNHRRLARIDQREHQHLQHPGHQEGRPEDQQAAPGQRQARGRPGVSGVPGASGCGSAGGRADMVACVVRRRHRPAGGRRRRPWSAAARRRRAAPAPAWRSSPAPPRPARRRPATSCPTRHQGRAGFVIGSWGCMAGSPGGQRGNDEGRRLRKRGRAVGGALRGALCGDQEAQWMNARPGGHRRARRQAHRQRDPAGLGRLHADLGRGGGQARAGQAVDATR